MEMMMSDRDDFQMHAQLTAMEAVTPLVEASVAASLAAGLMKPGEHDIDDAVAVYRAVLARLREGGGL